MTEITQEERAGLIQAALDREFAQGIAGMVSGELPQESWVWASFCDPDRPEGQQFLGVVIAPGSADMPAMFLSSLHMAGLNPGGEVSMMQFPSGEIDEIPADCRMRLLNREEAEAL